MVGLSGRHHVFAMLEPRFSRLLKASGLHFQQVGGVINYCGSRAPYYIDQRVAEAHLPKRIVPLYHTIKTQLAVQLWHRSAPLADRRFLNGRRHGGRRRNASGRDAGKLIDEIHERFRMPKTALEGFLPMLIVRLVATRHVG